MLAAVLSSAALIAALPPAPPQDTAERARALAEAAPDVVRYRSIGRSRGDREIGLLVVGRGDADALDRRPGVLLVAGAHAHYGLSGELALHHVQTLIDADGAAEADDLLTGTVLYVIPQLNPDGAALGRSGNARAIDLDRDGATDEDPHDDLDGDGLIAQMRWRSPEGTWLIDEEMPQLMRRADPAAGERGEFEVAAEGIDNDGDGEVDEDPGDGAQLHRGFSHDFAEFDRATGGLALGEPESRALADFVFAQRNIGMALVYGPDDTLLSTPKTDKGDRRAPLGGILAGDTALYEAAGEAYRDATGRKGKARDRHDGSTWSWLYCDVGVPAFAADLWRPPQPDSDDEQRSTEDRVRYALCTAAGRGFVAWHRVDHPQHGAVEIGGFAQLPVGALLGDDERQTLFDGHHRALLALLELRPRCRIDSFAAEAHGGGAYLVKAAVVNDGRAAALSAISAKSRRFSRPRLSLAIGGAALLAGRPQQTTDNLPAGGRQELQWWVHGTPGTVLTLDLTTDFAGRDRAEVTLP